MLRRSDIVAAARGWVGTPYHWQASVKGRGCDCKGLIVGVARELGLPEADSIHARLANYASVDVARLKRGLRDLFAATSEALPGDVLLLRVAGHAQHLALYAGDGRMIHTYGGVRQVIEVPMGNVWRVATDSIWSWRGIEP